MRFFCFLIFRHGSGDAVSSMGKYNGESQVTEHIFLRFHFYSILFYSELFNNINKFDYSFTQLDTKEQVNILLYG